MSGPIQVLATIQAQSDKVEQLKAVLENLAVASRDEEGCISYIVLQSLEQPTLFSTVEEWKSSAAIESHFQTAHLQAAFAKAESLLAAPPSIVNFRKII